MVFILITHCARQAEDIQKYEWVSISAGQNLLGLRRWRQESSLSWDYGVQKGMQKKYIPYILSSGHHHVARLNSTVVVCCVPHCGLHNFKIQERQKSCAQFQRYVGGAEGVGAGVCQCVLVAELVAPVAMFVVLCEKGWNMSVNVFAVAGQSVLDLVCMQYLDCILDRVSVAQQKTVLVCACRGTSLQVRVKACGKSLAKTHWITKQPAEKQTPVRE